jgi:D-galactarolactone cycloisomerase
MKISRISAYHLRAKLSRAFAFSQRRYDAREAAIVSVETEDGLTGWGEAYGPASPVKAAVQDLFAPLITGRDPRDHEDLWQTMFSRTVDHGQKGTLLAAISGIDIALWDLKAQAAGLPLYRLLGGAHTQSIPCYATGFYFSDDESPELRFRREAEQYKAQGFGAMKMKVGQGVETDVALVAMLRKLIGPEIRLMIDANHAYTPTEAIALGRRVERHEIYWFEEPVSPLDLDGYAEVKRALAIPIAGGECENTRFGFEPLLRRRLVDFAQPDLCACGGITEGMKIAALASVYNVHLTPHVWGTAIGQAAALHFYAARPRHPATTTPEDKLIECDQTEHPFRVSIAGRPLELANGCWLLPESPGLGIEVNRAALERFL